MRRGGEPLGPHPGPMSAEQRHALALLARPGHALRGTGIYDLASEDHQPGTRVHPGVAQALKRREFLAPMVPGRPDGYHEITAAGREALRSKRQARKGRRRDGHEGVSGRA